MDEIGIEQSEIFWRVLGMVIFTLLAWIFNAGMDKMVHHYYCSVFKDFPTPKNKQFFWQASRSWAYKYKSYLFSLIGENVYIQDYRPAFPGAKTWLVFLTDGWHLFQEMMWLSLAAAIACGTIFMPWWITFIGFRVIGGIAFSIFYHWIFAHKVNSRPNDN